MYEVVPPGCDPDGEGEQGSRGRPETQHPSEVKRLFRAVWKKDV